MAAYTLSQLRQIAPQKFKDLDDEDLVREYARINKVPFEQAADYYGVKARGTLGEMGRQAAGGAAVDLPRMVGQGLKATGIAPELGQRMVEGSEERAYQYEMDRRPERGLVGQALTLGARGLAPTVPIIASAFVPGGQVVAPALAAGLFGTSSYQETYEKLIDQGVSEKEAREAALKVGALQGGGQTCSGCYTWCPYHCWRCSGGNTDRHRPPAYSWSSHQHPHPSRYGSAAGCGD